MLPEKLEKMIDNGTIGMMATVLPSGLIQNQPVWIDQDDGQLVVNTEIERRKFKNLQDNPNVTVTVVDPDNHWSWVEVRGKMVDAVHGQEARDHIDKLAQRYLGVDDYPNPIRSPRVIVKIEPRQVFEFPPA